jgi:hypothetical protein
MTNHVLKCKTTLCRSGFYDLSLPSGSAGVTASSSFGVMSIARALIHSSSVIGLLLMMYLPS